MAKSNKNSFLFSIISIVISFGAILISFFSLKLQIDDDIKKDYRTNLSIEMKDGKKEQNYYLKATKYDKNRRIIKGKIGEIKVRNGAIEKIYSITKNSINTKSKIPYRILVDKGNQKQVNGEPEKNNNKITLKDTEITKDKNIPYIFYLVKSYDGKYQLYARIFESNYDIKNERFTSHFYDNVTILRNDEYNYKLEKVQKEYYQLKKYLKDNGIKL